MLNSVSLQGRCPFAITYKGEDDKLKAFFNLMVKRDYKADGEKYADDDKIFCVAYGAQANFLKNYANKGDNLCVSGRLVFVPETEDKAEYLFVKVEHVYIVNSGGKSDEDDEEEVKEKKTKGTSGKSGIGGKGGIGGGKSSSKGGIGGSKSGLGTNKGGLKTGDKKFSKVKL